MEKKKKTRKKEKKKRLDSRVTTALQRRPNPLCRIRESVWVCVKNWRRDDRRDASSVPDETRNLEKRLVLFPDVIDLFKSRLGGGGQQFVDEIHVADHVVLVRDDSEEFAELFSFGTVQLLAEGREDVEDLGKRNFASAVLVEDLQAFNVVLLDSGGGGVGFDGGENWKEIGESESLLAQSFGTTGSDDHGVGHVAAESAEDVAQIESIDIVAFVGFVEDDESVLGL